MITQAMEFLPDDDDLANSAWARALYGDVSQMTLWRWSRDPRIRCPAPDVIINGRRYWRKRTLRQHRQRFGRHQHGHPAA
jgi:hypothetical protein